MTVICEVGPRDGLQNEPEVLPPATRAELINRLAAAGLPRIEVVSFVRDDTVPQMAGAEEVVAGIERGLDAPGELAAERRAVAAGVVGTLDGRSAERVVRAIVEMTR